jgi:hypothetical protein
MPVDSSRAQAKRGQLNSVGDIGRQSLAVDREVGRLRGFACAAECPLPPAFEFLAQSFGTGPPHRTMSAGVTDLDSPWPIRPT